MSRIQFRLMQDVPTGLAPRRAACLHPDFERSVPGRNETWLAFAPGATASARSPVSILMRAWEPRIPLDGPTKNVGEVQIDRLMESALLHEGIATREGRPTPMQRPEIAS